jgi:hypothetical protein
MEKSTTTAVSTRRRRPRRMQAAAWAVAAFLLPACTPAASSLPPELPTAAVSQSAAPDTAVSPTAPPPTAMQSPAAAPANIPVRPAAPPAAAPQGPVPTSLTVAGTSINMTVIPVGVSPGGAMEIPDPFDQAGWYRFGPAPGADAGTAVIAGHIDTTSDRAPFSQLKTLAAGTAIQVGRQDAPPLVYRVVSVELMAKDSFDGDALFRRSGPHELKVVTCGGRWLDEVNDYSDNVIVTAVLE